MDCCHAWFFFLIKKIQPAAGLVVWDLSASDPYGNKGGGGRGGRSGGGGSGSGGGGGSGDGGDDDGRASSTFLVEDGAAPAGG